MTEDQYHKIRNQLWLVGFIVLIISTIEMLIFHNWALRRIEEMQCKCVNGGISANGNVITLQTDMAHQLAKEILQKQGKLDAINLRSSSGTTGSGTSRP